MCVSFSTNTRYVFDVYKNDAIFGNHSLTFADNEFHNESLNFGRILPEMGSVTLTCAAWGNWSPPKVPSCIRELL